MSNLNFNYSVSNIREEVNSMLLDADVRKMKELYSSKENILKRVCYPSDYSESRESAAFSVSLKGNTKLPSIKLEGEFPEIAKLLRRHIQQLVNMRLSGKRDPENSRYLLNFQNYRKGSKPVPLHFDGEYLDYEVGEDGSLNIKEAIVPSFVGIYIIYNNNITRPHGVELIHNFSNGSSTAPKSKEGDYILFNNYNFMHRVPELAESRAMLGFRSLDHGCMHYLRKDKYWDIYKIPNYIYDRYQGGFISKILKKKDVTEHLAQYYEKSLPSLVSKVEQEGAVF